MTVRPNHLLAIIGAIMLVSAMVGAFVVEEQPAMGHRGKREKTFHISFPLTNETASASGAMDDGGTGEGTLNAQLNVTTGNLVVTWTDHQPILRPAATVSVTVKDTFGTEVGSGMSSDGATGIAIPIYNGVSDVPEDVNISAGSEEDAFGWVTTNYPANTNHTWTVTVTSTRGGFSGPFRQGSIEWTADLQYTYYTADIQEASK